MGDKWYKIKTKGCGGSVSMSSPEDMYDALYYDLRNAQQAIEIIEWAKRKPIGAKFENDILTVEVIER